MSASPAKKVAAKTSKAVPSHPTYQQMVKMSVQTLKEPKGSSKAAILKYILANYKVGDNVKQINAHLRASLKRGVTTGYFKQVKGVGASGSFRLGEDAKKKTVAKPKKAAPKKATTTAAPKPKKATKPKAKKVSPKKAAVKKTTKSPKKPKSPKKKATPKKAAKPKAKKSPKKTAKK